MLSGLHRPTVLLMLAAACARPPAPHDASPAPRTRLLGNLGSYHRAITTSSLEAQQFFDEGLTLLYGFNHEEAFRSFARAAALDPAAPMPHWGMALALGTNINDVAPAARLVEAYAHLAEARTRAANGSEVEQGLIDALALRYVANPIDDAMTRERAYSDAMGALSKRFPDDLDVATLDAESRMNLRPWQLYDATGAPAPGTDAIVATLEAVMRANPAHPGANHYYIHAVEASNDPGRARPQAERLATLVPGAGHLVHMPAHVFIRTGDYAEAARTNAAAAAVDERYFETGAPQGMYATMYYSHNLQFESAAAMYAGAFAQARDAARRTVVLADPVADQMVMLEPFAMLEFTVLVRFGRWEEILAMARPPVPTRTLQTVLHHHAVGAALAGTGRTDEAAAELIALREAAKRIPADAMVGPTNGASAVAAIAAADLAGRVSEARGATDDAIAAFTAAVAAEDALGYNEPPDWLLPERERLGAILLTAGRAADAELVFRADLTRNVGNPRSLYGVWRSLVRQSKRGDVEARLAFERGWAGADVTLGDDLYGRP